MTQKNPKNATVTREWVGESRRVKCNCHRTNKASKNKEKEKSERNGKGDNQSVKRGRGTKPVCIQGRTTGTSFMAGEWHGNGVESNRHAKVN